MSCIIKTSAEIPLHCGDSASSENGNRRDRETFHFRGCSISISTAPLQTLPSQDLSPIEECAVKPSFIFPKEESLNYPPITLNSGPRQFRDLIFCILFLFLVIATFVFGICASALRNPNYSRVSSFSFDFNSSSCVLSRVRSSDSPFYLDSSPLPNYLVLTLVITLILSLPILFLVLWLLKKFPKQIVYGSTPFFVIIPTLLNVYGFVACTLKENCRESFPLAYRVIVLIFVFLIIGVIAWIIFVNWHRIELTSKILGSVTIVHNLL